MRKTRATLTLSWISCLHSILALVVEHSPTDLLRRDDSILECGNGHQSYAIRSQQLVQCQKHVCKNLEIILVEVNEMSQNY